MIPFYIRESRIANFVFRILMSSEPGGLRKLKSTEE